MNTLPPVPVNTRRETFAHGLTIRVDARGNGRPVLILHGAGGPRGVARFVEAVAEYAQVFAPIHPGFEGEPRPEWFDSVDDLALVYLDLLERLDLREVIVIGISFGGWVAAELAVRDTTRLSGLILADASGLQVDGHEISVGFTRTPDQPPADSNRPPVAGPPELSPEQAEVQTRNLQTMAVYSQRGFSDPKLRRRLARVTLPSLVIWGEDDHLVDPAYGQAYAQALPDARLVLIPGAGHFPQTEQPERFLTLVREFVDSIPVSPIPGAVEGR